MPVKVREIIRRIEADGWQLKNQVGSPRRFVHPSKLGKATVAGNPSDTLAPGTANNILKQARLK